MQTFWALHGQQHGLLRGSPEFNNPFTQESSLWFSTGVPKTRMEMVSADVTSSSYFMTNTSVTDDQGGKDACHRNHLSEYFSLSLNLDSMKRADCPFRSASHRCPTGPSQWCRIASGHPRTIDASCSTPTDPVEGTGGPGPGQVGSILSPEGSSLATGSLLTW